MAATPGGNSTLYNPNTLSNSVNSIAPRAPGVRSVANPSGGPSDNRMGLARSTYDQLNSPGGYSPMPGIVTRNNVTNVVGQPTSSPLIDAMSAQRQAAEQQRQQVAAQRASRLQQEMRDRIANNPGQYEEMGMVAPDGTPTNVIGPTRYAPGGGMARMSNLRAAMEDAERGEGGFNQDNWNAYQGRRDARREQALAMRQSQLQQSRDTQAAAMSNPMNSPMMRAMMMRNPEVAAQIMGTMAQTGLGQSRLMAEMMATHQGNALERERMRYSGPLDQANAERVKEETRLISDPQNRDRATIEAQLANLAGDASPQAQQRRRVLEQRLDALGGYENSMPTAGQAVMPDESGLFSDSTLEQAIRDTVTTDYQGDLYADLEARGIPRGRIEQYARDIIPSGFGNAMRGLGAGVRQMFGGNNSEHEYWNRVYGMLGQPIGIAPSPPSTAPTNSYTPRGMY